MKPRPVFISAACVLLSVPMTTASAALVPQYGPVKQTGAKTRWLSDVSRASIRYVATASGEAHETWEISIRVPSSARTIVKTTTLTAQNALINGGKSFPLARVTTTARFTDVARSYTERIYSSNFDRYWNVCVNDGKKVWASGGDVYCEVYHSASALLTQTSKIKNYPHPVIVSEQDGGAVSPDCTPGDTKVKVTGKTGDVYECQDASSDSHSGGDFGTYQRQGTVTARVFNGTRWVTSTTTGTVVAYGPSWVMLRNEPLPAPTVTLTTSTIKDTIIGPQWLVGGDITCLYEYERLCPLIVDIALSNGTTSSHYLWRGVEKTSWSTSLFLPVGVSPTGAVSLRD